MFHVDNSKVYFSNTDGALTRRELDSDDELSLEPRQLRSEFISSNNVGTIGSGFVYAINNSNIILKGQNLQFNKGKEGGVVAMKESTLFMEDTVSEGHLSETYGGFLVSIDSYFEIEVSVIGQSLGGESCVLFALGQHAI